MGHRSFCRLQVTTAAALFLGGCGGGDGQDSILTTLLEPINEGRLSSNALTAFFVESFSAFEDKANELRNSQKYKQQEISWYVETNEDRQHNQDTEPLYNSYSLASSRAEYAHAVGLTGLGQTIAIVDEGFLTTHETIAGRIIDGGMSGDALSHGTAVASVAAGNSATMIGVAPGARLLFGNFTSAANLAEATDLARTVGAVVQNNSWGFPTIPATSNEFDRLFVQGNYRQYLTALRAYTQNGIVVFAASNDSSDTQSTIMEALPLFAPELETSWLAVINGVPEFDNERILRADRVSAACLDAARWCIAADGTWMAANDNPNNQGYSLAIGTSFSAPVVSGAIALLAEAFPNLTPQDLRARLIATADNRFEGFAATGRLEVIPGSGFYHDYSEEWGHGFLDVRAALLPIGTPVATMADGTALSVEQPLINGGGATGDAITRSLESVPVLVTDLLGGDFTMPGTALATMPRTAPVSEKLWSAMFGNAPRHSLMQEYGGADITLTHDTFELAMLSPDTAHGSTAGDGSEPAAVASIGKSFEAAGGAIFIGLNLGRDDGSVLPGLQGTSSTFAALEVGFSQKIGSAGFIELGGTFGMSPDSTGIGMSNTSDVRFNAMRVEAGQTGVLRKGDRLSLGVSMPIAVTSGSTQIALPAARSAGGVSYQDVGINYAPQAREIDLSITYGTPMGQSAEVFVGAIHAFNHGHITGRQDTAAIMGFRVTF